MNPDAVHWFIRSSYLFYNAAGLKHKVDQSERVALWHEADVLARRDSADYRTFANNQLFNNEQSPRTCGIWHTRFRTFIFATGPRDIILRFR